MILLRESEKRNGAHGVATRELAVNDSNDQAGKVLQPASRCSIGQWCVSKS